MKKKLKFMSPARKKAARGLVAKLTNKLSFLELGNKRGSSEYKKLDLRLGRVQRATRHRW